MQPAKQLANGVRYLGDCFDVIPKLPHKYDLLLTDPPYAMPATYYVTDNPDNSPRRWSDTLIMSRWFETFIGVVMEKIKHTGTVGFFCDAVSSATFLPTIYNRFRRIHFIVWDKKSIGLGHPIRPQHELVLVGHGNPSTIPRGYSSVISCPRVLFKDKTHPAQKPVPLLAELIKRLCPEGGRILDPFAGSGSTYEAAKACGRYCDLIEYDERDRHNQDVEQEILGI